MENKRGISGIIGVVILIALVFAAGVIVWIAVINLVTDKLEGAGSCIDIFEKVNLNSQYTCFDSTNNRVLFSINRADVDISAVVVVISTGGSSKSFTLNETDYNLVDITDYPTPDSAEKMPGKNEGRTYYCTSTTVCASHPDKIEIAPVVDNKQCSAIDSIDDIPFCSELGL